MNELSKERLENYASGRWYPDADYVKAMARELLALRERAEPVVYMNRFTGRAFELEQQPGADKDPDVYIPLYAAPPAPVVPDEWRSVLQEMVNAMLAYEMDVGEPAPYKHRKMMMRAGHLLESHRAAMLAAPTHVATSEVTQDFKPVSRKKCRKCDQEVFGYTVNGLCEDCYSAAPVVPAETFEEWSRRCEIQLTLCRPEFREVAEITWNACRAAMLAAPGKEW
ncbi:hypothetical protein SMZ60_002266 [Cronobacter sakazakii]|nr:hypothetical protein [Cronobacter sakazakii]ELY4459758.1 hypothetical protein [Cronobacter sakazakii]ELY5795261.1 hypothetical protein [Cronobacter sakazakii]